MSTTKITVNGFIAEARTNFTRKPTSINIHYVQHLGWGDEFAIHASDNIRNLSGGAYVHFHLYSDTKDLLSYESTEWYELLVAAANALLKTNYTIDQVSFS